MRVLPNENDENIGELIVGGSQLMNGYVNKKYEFLKLDKKKYYNTGDLVKIEKERFTGYQGMMA